MENMIEKIKKGIEESIDVKKRLLSDEVVLSDLQSVVK